jgi:tRNA nucleotidyltransferase/poly(A) polymerase
MKTDAIKIIKTLRSHGFQAYLVGGCVRDFLMGNPAKDWDIATDARPEQVRSL